ncbi:MAG: hypothetical protein DRJ10_00785 [Bacteroidetes bacterium]|nr:MAG: hypothetical protein DRJ10_00785 [Bacteroidota bacterium]
MLKISNNTTCNECVKTAIFQRKVTQTKGDVFLNTKKQKFVKKWRLIAKTKYQKSKAFHLQANLQLH